MGDLAAVLPMAFVMVAGPQIVSAIFLATSERWLRNSLLFLAGVVGATALGTGVAYFGCRLAGQAAAPSGHGMARAGIQWAIVVLLLFLAVRVVVKRRETDPPRWMGRLQSADGSLSFKIGFLLFLLMPTDVVSMVTVGAHLARQGSPYWHVATFLAATVLLAGAPLVADLLLGRRAATALPRLRDWMNTNSWIVSEVVILYFLVSTGKGLLQGA